MQLKPFKHQEKFVKDYTGSNILAHEAGTGKTVCACLWLKDARDEYACVLCPDKVIKKWQKALKDWGVKDSVDVIGHNEFNRVGLNKRYNHIVLDEAHVYAGSIFTRDGSQRAKDMYTYYKDHHPEMLLLSATPIRSNPWNLHTVLTFAGKYIDYKIWREKLFDFKKEYYMARPGYMPKDNWRQICRKVLEVYADIVLLKDCVGELPEETHENVSVKKDVFSNTEWEGKKAFVEEHIHEQKYKAKYIKEIGEGFNKVLVVAHYTDHIEQLRKELDDRPVFVIQGGVKNQEDVIKQAQDSKYCYLIVQYSMGEGFDLDTFSCVVFASMGYGVSSYVQMKARIRRISNLTPSKYYYLIAGDCDKAVLETIKSGRDFVPSEWNKALNI